jgi:UTP--glucose-1-phosphate uridylyltransferase
MRTRTGRTAYAPELRRMMDVFRQLQSPHLVSVTRILKSRMSQYGVVRTAARESLPAVHPIMQLVERPPATHAICRATHAFGIVGRYLLQPSIFGPLRELRESGQRPVHLTDALERLRRTGHKVYACELAAARQDVGEIFGQAGDLIGGFPERPKGTEA